MAYTQAYEGKRGTRHRGFYQDADGRYRSAGTYDTAERALEVPEAAEKHAAKLISDATGDLDPVTRATRTIVEYAPVFMRHHRVEGNTKDTYAGTLRSHVVPFLGKVRVAETNRTVARNYFTALEESGRSANTIRQAKIVPRGHVHDSRRRGLPGRQPVPRPENPEDRHRPRDQGRHNRPVREGPGLP